MIFFLLFYFFPSIRADCLEFTNTSLRNQCLIVDSRPWEEGNDSYYPQCLQCTIETLIERDEIQFEEKNSCLAIELQCVQLRFPTREIFEDFFQFYQELIYDLFSKDNGTDQNTLHITIQKNTLMEINAAYIEGILQVNYAAYRAFFLELFIENQIIRINRDLTNITRLSIKLILVCGQRKETIYVIHNRNITLESKDDPCSPILIPSTSIIISTSIPNEALAVSHEKSKNIVLIIILLTAFLLSLCIAMTIYCLKRIRHRYRRVSKEVETTSEQSSISQDEIPNDQPKLSLKLKRPARGMRALQLLDDDI